MSNYIFEPCENCPFDAKSEKDCKICEVDSDDYLFKVTKEYSASQPWNAPGMGVNDFIR